jgi:CRISPR-associated protein Csd1
MSILEHLVELARSEQLVTDPDYEERGVAWLVHVTPQGQLLPFVPTKAEPTAASGKKESRLVPRIFSVPRQPIRAAADRAFFLCDKSEYVFGQLPPATPAATRSASRLRARAKLFRDQVAACFVATSDPGVGAVLAALDDVAAGAQTVTLPADCAPNDLFAFIYTPDVDTLVHERSAVRNYWAGVRKSATESPAVAFQCAVTGQPMGNPGLFPKVKYVPGGAAAGVSLVSFNAPAFRSYGLSANENAPISREAAEQAATALERLVHPAPVYGGRHLNPRHIRIAEDALVVFWAPHPRASGILDVFANLLELSDPAVVGDLYRSIWFGHPVDVGDAGRFYALTLSGAQGRMIIRDWFESSVAEVSRNLAQHFADLTVVRNTPRPKDGELPPQIPLNALLRSLSPFGKREEIPAALVTDFIDAALRGTPYPFSLLQRALERTRAEIGKTDWSDFERRDARAALIKAVLERRRRFQLSTALPEITPAMNATNASQGYLLGRLLAVLERLQQLALDDVNASVVDRYFGAASATPRAAFPRLLRNARHHARKAKDDPAKAGTARWLDRLIDEIASGLASSEAVTQGYRGTVFAVENNALPAYLSLDQQGLFVLGYHHQRHQLWTKRTEPAETTSPSTPASDTLIQQ